MTVFFVGAGPGAADLLTLRAVNVLARVGMCLYAGTYLDQEVLEHCGSDCELVDTQNLDLDQIVAAIARAHDAGLDVARLCSGDPSLYSALTEQTLRLDALGIPWEVTPGVPAYAAAAAILGSELTVPEVVQSVVLTRTQARSTAMPESEALADFAKTGSTLVLHLAITRIRAIATELTEQYGEDCPVAVVYRASQPRERVIRGTLATIANLVEAAGIRQAAVVIVSPALRITTCQESHLYSPQRRREGAANSDLPAGS